MKYGKVRLETRENEVKNYLKNEIEKGRFPLYKELQKKFNITYFKINFKKLYSDCGVDFLYTPTKRPKGCQNILKEELIEYVKREVEKGHFPSRRELEKTFRIKIGILFGNIENLYIEAGSKYLKKENQQLKEKKAKILLDLSKNILEKLNLEILSFRGINERGIDIITNDINGRKIGMELKAYNKFESIKEKDILQMKRMLNKENILRGIIITTTSRIQKNLKIPRNIKIIAFNSLEKLINPEVKGLINFIRDYSVHYETKEKVRRRKEIIEYFKEIIKKNKAIKISELSKDLKIDFYSYFESVYDLYKEAEIVIPSLSMRGIRNKEKIYIAKNDLINKISNFIEVETKKGYYPTGKDIKKTFGISHIWNFVRMSELYRKLNLPPYLERKHRFKK